MDWTARIMIQILFHLQRVYTSWRQLRVGSPVRVLAGISNLKIPEKQTLNAPTSTMNTTIGQH